MIGPMMMRSAVGCAIACGAIVVGSSTVGTPAAKADLLGIGGGGVDVLGINVLGGGDDKRSNSGPAAVRGSTLPAVSTAPSTRPVVVRSKFVAAQPDPTTVSRSFLRSNDRCTCGRDGRPDGRGGPRRASTRRAAPPPRRWPCYRLPEAPQLPSALPIPATIEPEPGRQFAPADSFPLPTSIPDSFRVGYAEYLRAATTSDLLVATLPGVAGLAGFTLIGAYAGYRQARAVQAALLPAAPTSVLL